MTTTRDRYLDRLALGSNCPSCHVHTDESCITRRTGSITEPHQSRIDRAVRQFAKRGH